MKLDNKDAIVKYLKKHTVYEGDCWIYKRGGLDKGGHRFISVDYKLLYVHRISAYLFLGLDLSNKGQQVNHTAFCINAACWNPEHIYIGSQAQNIQDSVEVGHHRNARKTLCHKGHELTTRLSNGTRYCQTCAAANRRLRRQKEVTHV